MKKYLSSARPRLHKSYGGQAELVSTVSGEVLTKSEGYERSMQAIILPLDMVRYTQPSPTAMAGTHHERLHNTLFHQIRIGEQ